MFWREKEGEYICGFVGRTRNVSDFGIKERGDPYRIREERTMDLTERVLAFASFTIRQGSTVRETAKAFGVSKSTVHKDLTMRLPQISQRLYRQVQEVLQFHLSVRHLRGGEATRKKYLAAKKGKNV